MSLTSDIIARAYRETNLIPLVSTPSTLQQTEALDLLNTILLSSVGNEIGKELNELNIGGIFDESEYVADWIPADARIVYYNLAPKTINLHPEPVNGQRLGFVDTTGSLSTNPVTLNGYGRNIEGLSSIVLNVNNDNRQWIYRADTGNWVKVTSLALTDQMPFPQDFDDYFITVLALRLNPRYGQTLTGESMEALKRGKRNIRARYRSNTEMFPEYIGVIGEIRGHYYNSKDFGRGVTWRR